MARKKTWTLVGHSNGEGQAGSDPMIASAPWLATRISDARLLVGGSPNPLFTPSAKVQNYKNIMVFTNPLGWPALGTPQTVAGIDWQVHRYPVDGAGGTPYAHNGPLQARTRLSPAAPWSPLGYKDYPTTPGPEIGRWLPMNVYLPYKQDVFASPNATPVALGPHPYNTSPNLDTYRLRASDLGLPTPYSPYFAFPNTRSIPVPPYWYDAAGGIPLFGVSGTGTLVGCEFPLSWRLSQYWGEAPHLVKVSIPGSFLLRHDRGERNIPAYGWFSAAEHYDFSPDTARLYDDWYRKMQGAQAELALTDDKMDVQLIVLWQGDNDSTQEADRTEKFDGTYRALMRAMREACADNDWSTLPSHQIKILMMGIYHTYDGGPGNPDRLNSILQVIADDDPYASWINTDAFSNLVEDGYPLATGAGGHFGHVGYLDAADMMYDGFLELEFLADDAYGIEDRVTVEDARNRVLRYYERGTARTDAADEIINQHMNAALFRILNTCGDQAWWLRRMLTMAISSAPSQPVLLPKIVHRLLRIETPEAPTYPLQFEMLGFAGGGRMQIVLKERHQGSFVIHFITQPKELSSDGELIPLPYNLIEWLVVETCRRLARASGNIALQASLQGEAAVQKADCMRNMGVIQRPRFDRLHSQRRLYGYNRGAGYWRYPFPFN